MTCDDHTTSRLLRQARQGNDDALGQLLEIYRGYVGLLAQLQINRQLRGKVSPSDVVQDTFLKAKRGFSEFRGQNERELVGWLRSILANQLAELLRRYQTEKRHIDREVCLDLERSSQALVTQLRSEQASPSEHAANREEAVLLADALTRLPADHREVLLLRHMDGMQFPEVAQRMGRSIDSVKGLWTRAVVKLRIELGATL